MRVLSAQPIIYALLLAALAGCTPVFAQGADFGVAVSTFNAAKYPQAADMFTQYLRQQPQDALAHYYLGVTWHCLGRAREAEAEYSWVKQNSADPELLKRADMGLQVVARSRTAVVSQPAAPPQGGYQPAYGQPDFQPQPVPLNGMGYQPTAPAGGGATGWLSPTGAQRAASVQNVSMQGKIVDLFATWCGPCKRFAPVFEQARSKYGNAIAFESLNSEAEGAGLAKKYKIHGVPTILLFDNNGRLVQRIDGAPQSLQDFETTIFAAYPGLRSY
jgi:thiol-disulfide isomerase/thioredoxin